MKLALVIPGFQADEHDWCIPAFTNLAQELSRHAEIHVFALRYPHKRSSYDIGSVHVHALGGGTLLGGIRAPGVSLLKLWSDGLSAIRSEHTRQPFNAMLGIWATESGWVATRAANMLGVPSLVHLAGGELTWIPQIKYGNRGQGLAGLLTSRTLHAATVLTTPSSTIRQALAPFLNPTSPKVHDWALGVDTQMFSPSEHQSDSTRPFTFITVGSLVPVKGHALLLRSFARFRKMRPNADMHLNIVGTGPLLSRLQRLASQLQLEGYVSFTGEVRHDQLPALYHQADCFVLTSWHEAQCMAVLEAMACGLRWIGPPVGAVADLGAKGQTSGILVRERTPDALAQAMQAVMEQAPVVHNAWSRAARERVERDYELKKQAVRLLRLVEALTLPSGAGRMM